MKATVTIMFQILADNKRYYTQNRFLNRKFGKKVAKITLDAGFTCPNIDGTRGHGGCIYCDSTPIDPLPLATQFEQGRNKLVNKWNNFDCIAYLNAHTNTYAPIERIKPIVEQVLAFEDVVGLSIATRADCLPPDIVSYLTELSARTFLTVELGLQTIHDKTATYINRCHTTAEFVEGYQSLYTNGINISVHIINGLPFETHEMMLETVDFVAKLHPHSVKLHSLHILEGTPIAGLYRSGAFTLPTKEQYIAIVCDQIERLSEDIVIERVTGDGDKSKLIAPKWSADKRAVLNGIDLELARRNTVQGCRFRCSVKQ